MHEVSYWDLLSAAVSQIETQDYQPKYIHVFNPKDYKRLHIDKVSIRFMQIIKRNRKLRNNGK